jgi:uncharacterized membrane protein
VLAAIRADSVNLPLFLHVLGAMLLVGALAAVAFVTVVGWRTPDRAGRLGRFALKMLLVGVLPAWIVMRIAAQWTESEENLPDDFEPAWLGIGYITAELGGLLILISAVLAGIGLRRSREDSTRSVLFARIVGIVCILLLAAYLVAMWAMTAKPD